ncbi:hypothetical protein B9Z55_004598 [Caenorhabditis nigoni]|nr:hypothetical protein B9Z55_004598 [Caenorhabditis nigoni]
MVGVGGYQFARRFSSVAGDETKRQTFQNSITAFLIYHKLDGVDIFWAWPKAKDRENCLKLIKGLRQNLPAQFLISMILPRLAQQLDGYILNSLVDYVDFFNVLSYDYFEPLPGNGANIGPISPMYGGQRGNVDGTMKRLTCEIRKPSKLNLGITLYGTYWNNVESGLGQKRDDIWRLAEVENGPGYSIGWREMEQRNWNLSAANWHEASKSSYIWNPRNKRFLGFESEKSLQEKVIYAKNKNIGGIVVWTMDQDDDKDSVLNIMTSVDMCERGTGDSLNFLFLAIDENGSISFAGDSGEERFLQMKETALSIRSEIKVMFSVGSHSTAFHFSKIVVERKKRRFLINSITSFIDEHDLDGVDVFWIWPSKQDRRSYIRFLQELKKSLAELKIEKKRAEDYIISIIAPRNPSEFEGFNLVEIMDSVDFINVLSYDYYYTTLKVGPLSPLYGGTEGNVDETMKYLSCKTENSRKLNMGVTFYGTTYLNTDLPFGNDSFWIPTSSETKGPFGVRWNQITSDEKSKAKWDNISRTPYSWEDRKFFTFENEKSMREKMKYAEDHNIGGILIWVIDQDDDENTLLSVVSSVDLCSGSSLLAYSCGN